MKVIELEILLNLNVDPSSTPFTYSMLSDPTLPKSGQYKNPFFTADVDYNTVDFQEKYTPYKDIIEIFFNKAKFTRFFQSRTKTQVTNAESNVIKMLTLIFPTRFSTYPKPSSSIAESYGGSSFGQVTGELAQLNPLATKLKQFSYLTVSSQKSTVFRVVWLNDVLNNSRYHELMEAIKKYYISSQIQNPALDNERKKFADLAVKLDHKDLTTKLGNIKVDAVSSGNQTAITIAINQKKEVFTNFLTALLTYQTLPTIEAKADPINIDKLVDAMVTLEPIINDKSDTVFNFIIRDITQAYKVSENIANIMYVKKNFLEKGRIDVNYNESVLPKYAAFLSKNQPFNDLIIKIKEYTSKYISGNQALQDLITKYAQGYDEAGDMVSMVYTVYKQKLGNGDIDSALGSLDKPTIMGDGPLVNLANTQLIYTSVERNTAIIELMVDVITGEINDSNKSQIACKLKDETLGNSLENIWYGSTQGGLLTSNRISASLLADMKKPALQTAPAVAPVAQPMVGKGRKKRNYKKRVTWKRPPVSVLIKGTKSLDPSVKRKTRKLMH